MKVLILLTFTILGYVKGVPFITDDFIIKLASIITGFIGLPKPIPEIVDEAFLEATELIKRSGYPAENHTLTTPDGYILTNHRIPYGKTGKTNKSTIPVLVVHGMNCESTQWFDNGPESLAFVLADAGYDVWLANVRGTSYSSHTNLTHDDDKFWDFYLQDLSQHDVLPLIDYILNKTKFSKLLYIGQSLGAVISFSLLAENPEYNKKIAGNIAMAPVGQVKYTTFLLRPVLGYHKQIRALSKSMNLHKWLSVSPLARKLQMVFCPSENPIICEASLSMMGGYNPYLRNKTRVPIYCNHCTSGSSLNIMIHLGQMMFSDEIRHFDHGIEENLMRYNSVKPPAINLSGITVPTVFIHAANDILASPLDVECGIRMFPNVFDTYLLPHPMAIHTDFMFAKHGKAFLYDKIVDYLKKLWQ